MPLNICCLLWVVREMPASSAHPRHIIDMMVEMVNPKKNETILDPACGTAGFLISAYRHILAQNKDEDGKSALTADDRKRLTENFPGTIFLPIWCVCPV